MLKRAFLALALALAWVSTAWAVSTTPTTLTTTAYTDLGAGPMQLGASGAGLIFQISDTLPSVGSSGFVLQNGAPSQALTTTAHVWARAITSQPTYALTAPLSSGAVGGDGAISPLGYCQLSVTAAVQTSTCPSFPTSATYVAVCNEGSAARWRDDGTAPTTTVGQPLGSGTATAPSCIGVRTTLSTLQWIAQSGTATLNLSFYK